MMFGAGASGWSEGVLNSLNAVGVVAQTADGIKALSDGDLTTALLSLGGAALTGLRSTNACGLGTAAYWGQWGLHESTKFRVEEP